MGNRDNKIRRIPPKASSYRELGDFVRAVESALGDLDALDRDAVLMACLAINAPKYRTFSLEPKPF